MNYAGFWKRFLAKIIDTLIFIPFILLNMYVFKSINKDLFLAVSLSITTLTLLYNVLFIYFLGKTPGKIILKLKVIKTDGSKVGLCNSILREAFSIVSLLIGVVQQFEVFGVIRYIDNISFAFTMIFMIENLTYFFNYRCKTIHDYIADTIVIDEVKK